MASTDLEALGRNRTTDSNGMRRHFLLGGTRGAHPFGISFLHSMASTILLRIGERARLLANLRDHVLAQSAPDIGIEAVKGIQPHPVQSVVEAYLWTRVIQRTKQCRVLKNARIQIYIYIYIYVYTYGVDEFRDALPGHWDWGTGTRTGAWDWDLKTS